MEPFPPPSVLVLDDGPAASTALAENGFAVTDVQAGEEAMHLLHERPFDLILLDMCVPGWNSLEACCQIRKFAPGSKIIMLAAVDADEDRIRALEAWRRRLYEQTPPAAGVGCACASPAPASGPTGRRATG